MAKKYKPKPWKDMAPQERSEYREGERVDRIVNFFLLILAALFFFWYLANEESYTQLSQSIVSGRTRARAAMLPPLSALLAVVSIFRLARSYLRSLAHMLDDLPEDRPAAQFWLWLKQHKGWLFLGLIGLLAGCWLLADIAIRLAASSGLPQFAALQRSYWQFKQNVWGTVEDILGFIWGIFLFFFFMLSIRLIVSCIWALMIWTWKLWKWFLNFVKNMFKK